MARLRFKNFSDLAFIQSIDKPRHFRPFLSDYSDYFKRQGIDLAALKNGDGADRKLLSVFTQPDEEMPAPLMEALYVLDDLSDELGHDRIRVEADRSKIELNGIGEDLNPGEFAMAIYRQKPELVRHCHENTIYRKLKNYHEFQAVKDKKLSLKSACSAVSKIEKQLALWFKKMDRSSFCDIYVYQEDGEIKFQITHGRTSRTNGTIDKNLKRSRIAFRPQKHDSVIYDNRTCVLKVNGQTPGEREAYRRAIGEVLFGDAEHFPAGDIYTLDPLKRPGFKLKITEGIDSARLTEVCIEVDDDDRFVQTSKGVDLVARAGKASNPNLGEGKIVRGAFIVKYSSGGRARKLELRPPNIAVYDRERDGGPAEKFMSANGFLKLDMSNGDQ